MAQGYLGHIFCVHFLYKRNFRAFSKYSSNQRLILPIFLYTPLLILNQSCWLLYLNYKHWFSRCLFGYYYWTPSMCWICKLCSDRWIHYWSHLEMPGRPSTITPHDSANTLSSTSPQRVTLPELISLNTFLKNPESSPNRGQCVCVCMVANSLH